MLRSALVLVVILLAAEIHAEPASSEANRCADASEKGQLLRINGKLRQARAEFLECVKDACPVLVRKDCAQFLVELESTTPTIVLAARDPSGADLTEVRVTADQELLTEQLDGKAITMDPGVHRFRFEAKGRVAVEQTVVVREGERNRVIAATLTPEPSPVQPSADRPVAAWVASGVAVVGLGTFVVLGLSARADVNDLEARCGTRCPEDDVDGIRRKALMADIGLGIGLLGAGVATYLFIDHARKPAVVQPSLGAGYIGITARF